MAWTKKYKYHVQEKHMEYRQYHNLIETYLSQVNEDTNKTIDEVLVALRSVLYCSKSVQMIELKIFEVLLDWIGCNDVENLRVNRSGHSDIMMVNGIDTR